MRIYSTKQAASRLQVSSNTIRNWTGVYSEQMSDSAKMQGAGERRFTERDLTVLDYIKTLKGEGLREGEIKERLLETEFADTEVMVESPLALHEGSTEISSADSQEGLQQAPALMLALEAMQRQIDGLQADRTERRAGWERDALIYVLGLTSGLLLLVGVLAAMALWGGG